MSEPPPRTLDHLRTLVDEATRLVTEVANDPLLPRVAAVLGDMLPEDRAEVVATVVKEIEACLQTQKGGVWSGFSVMRVNPGARLFRRAGSGDPSAVLVAEEVWHAAHFGVRLTASLPDYEPGEGWSAETVAMARALPAGERAAMRGLVQGMIDALSTADSPTPTD